MKRYWNKMEEEIKKKKKTQFEALVFFNNVKLFLGEIKNSTISLKKLKMLYIYV